MLINWAAVMEAPATFVYYGEDQFWAVVCHSFDFVDWVQINK